MKRKALVLVASAFVALFSQHEASSASVRTLRNIPLSPYDTQLRQAARQAKSVQLFGIGPIWHRTTHLYDRDGAMRDDVATGIQIFDRRLIDDMMHCFRCSTARLSPTVKGLPAKYTEAGSIQICFSKAAPHRWRDDVNYGLEEISGYATYRRYGGVGYCTDTTNVNTLVMLPGSGQYFEAFVKRMARRAHSHKRGVSFFTYIPQSLAPS